MNDAIKIERTGDLFSFASTEYRVTYPDGYIGSIWSPLWHELDDDEEDAEALRYAQDQWGKRTHRTHKGIG